jgi:hypothetical protein
VIAVIAGIAGIAVIADIARDRKPQEAYRGFTRMIADQSKTLPRIARMQPIYTDFLKGFQAKKLAANQREMHESNEIKPGSCSFA